MSADKENMNLRVVPAYKDTSQKYLLDPEDYEIDLYHRQYFIFYRQRLDFLWSRLLNQAQGVLGHQIQPTALDKLEFGKDALIFGVIVKKSKKRPSVLTEFEMPNFRSEEDEVLEETTRYSILDSVCSAEDRIELESTEQRLVLAGNIDKDDFVTGFVVGLYGKKDKTETFVVEEVIYPELAPQIDRPLQMEETYVVFLSGIALDSDLTRNENTCLALTQLMDWIYGCGSDEDIELARRVSRIVIAGDSVHITVRDINEFKITKIGQKSNYEPTAIEQLDRVLENFVRTVPVDVMSGPNDICDPMLPQQPVCVRAFDRCHRFGVEMFNVVPNPYSFLVDGISFLGTAGQNLHDLLKYTRGQPSLSLIRHFLERSYLFPTCPDTIDGVPLRNKDPFVVEEIPHVFFVGNQSDHEFEMCEFENGARTLLMTIPKFHEKYEAVLLNVKTMETQVLRFEQMPMTS